MKKKKSQFQKRILYSARIVFLLLIFAFLSGIVCIFIYQEDKDYSIRFFLMICISIMISLSAYYIYRKYVIDPISRLEDAIDILESADEGNNLSFEETSQSLSDSLTRIIQKLKISMEREHAAIVLQQESEYAELQSQINPHFLYNTLETIRGQAFIDDNYKIADMTEALANYFRYNIGKDNDQVALDDEITNIYNYIHIQQYRFEDKFTFQIYTHEESKDYLTCVIPKMTLQPIVENAIFHGIEGKMEEGHISVQIETTKDLLIIRVADDGIGMDEETLNTLNYRLNHADGTVIYRRRDVHNGIAMDNVNNRLKLLFGKQYGLHISSTKMVGTEVEICIPKIIKEPE